jgi:hypothetical protein
VVVCAAAGDAVAVLGESGCDGLGVFDDLLLVVYKAGLQGFKEADGFGGYDVHEGAALYAGEDLRVDLFDELFAVGEDDAASGATEGFVGGGGDEVCVLHGVGVYACCDEASDVGHVYEEVGADAAGDLSHAFEVDDAWVGGGKVEIGSMMPRLKSLRTPVTLGPMSAITATLDLEDDMTTVVTNMLRQFPKGSRVKLAISEVPPATPVPSLEEYRQMIATARQKAPRGPWATTAGTMKALREGEEE